MANYPTRTSYPSSRTPASPADTAAHPAVEVDQPAETTATTAVAQSGPEATPTSVAVSEVQASTAEVVPSTAASDVADAGDAPGVTLSVITNHSDSKMAQIIRGTVGTVKNNIFEIDGVYPKIAHLFTLMSASMTGQGTILTDVTLPNQKAAQEFIINMVSSSGDQWDKMYSQFGDDQSEDLGAMMIRNERNMVRQNVARVLSESGLSSYDIPVQYESFVSQPDDEETAEGSNLFTEIDLATAGLRLDSSIAIIADAPISVSSEEAVESADLNDQALAHRGAFQLEVKGCAKVLASSPENAMAIVSSLLEVSNRSSLQNLLTLKPLSVNNMTLTPYTSNSDYDRGSY